MIIKNQQSIEEIISVVVLFSGMRNRIKRQLKQLFAVRMWKICNMYMLLQDHAYLHWKAGLSCVLNKKATLFDPKKLLI